MADFPQSWLEKEMWLNNYSIKKMATHRHFSGGIVQPLEFQQLAGKINLVFDNPESVARQVKQIKFAQKQLRQFKKELSASVRNINESAAQARADSMASVFSDLTGSRKLAGSIRASNKRKIQKAKKETREPLYTLRAEIDKLILEGDRLKLLAEEYLEDPQGFQARIIKEKEQIAREREMLIEEAKIKQKEDFEKAARMQESYSILYKKKWFKPYLIIGFLICFFILFTQSWFVALMSFYVFFLSMAALADEVSKREH